VTIEFIDPDTSAQITPPFEDATNPIHIAAGTHKDEVVRAGAAGEFFYNLTCQHCGTVVEPPEMIVP